MASCWFDEHGKVSHNPSAGRGNRRRKTTSRGSSSAVKQAPCRVTDHAAAWIDVAFLCTCSAEGVTAEWFPPMTASIALALMRAAPHACARVDECSRDYLQTVCVNLSYAVRYVSHIRVVVSPLASCLHTCGFMGSFHLKTSRLRLGFRALRNTQLCFK